MKQNKENLFNKWCGENFSATCTKIKLELYLPLLTKVNAKWIKYYKNRPEAIQYIEENTERTLQETDHKGKDNNIYIYINKWDYKKN